MPGPAAARTPAPAAVPADVGVEVVVEAGPSAGASFLLGPGRHVVGRAVTAAVRVDDALIELHHALIEVSATAAVTFTQIAGRVPCCGSNPARADADDPLVEPLRPGRPRRWRRAPKGAPVQPGDGRFHPAATSSLIEQSSAHSAATAVPSRTATGTTPGSTPATGTVTGFGAPVTPLGPAAPLGPGTVVTVGASRLRVGRWIPERRSTPAVLAPLAGDPWRRTLRRPPRSRPAVDPIAVEVPADRTGRPTSTGGLLAAALAVLGGVVVAVVLRNPMFLVFSAVGLLVALGSRFGGRVDDRKQRRRLAVDARCDLQRFAAMVDRQRREHLVTHRAAATTIESTLAALETISDSVWSRRCAHGDSFSVTLGWGEGTWTVRLGPGSPGPEAEAIVTAAQRLDDEPVLTDLGPTQALAVVGGHGAAIARALVVQLATWTGPADWRLLVIADDVADWAWCRWLPHATATATAPMGVARRRSLVVAADDAAEVTEALRSLDDGDERHVLVVTDRMDLLATRTGPLRRYLGAAPSTAVLAVVGAGAAVPSMCRSLLEVGILGRARWCRDTSLANTSTTLHIAGLGGAAAEGAARRLAGLHDPEDPLEATGATPAGVGLSTLMQTWGGPAIDDAIAIAARWRTPDAHDAHRGHPRAAIGLTADGVVEVDLVRDGPHALIAGTTGSGKSELLRTLVASMAGSSSPAELTFVLVDYKGGSTFDACADLPHTVGVVTDLDDRLAERALTSLEAEIKRRERVLRNAGVDSLDAYRDRMRQRLPSRADRRDDQALGPTEPCRSERAGLSAQALMAPLPRLVVVIDEFAALAAELPQFLAALVGVAQRGRSLGIHLVLATQRPAGVVSDEIRANTNLRLALRLQDRSDAVDIVGDPEPSTFARGTPGRAMMRLGPGETIVFQTANSSGPYRPVDDAAVRIARDDAGAAATGGRPGDSWDQSAHAAEARPPGVPSELAVLVGAIRGAASLCEIEPPLRPWLPPLPASLTVADVATSGLAVPPPHPRGGDDDGWAAVAVMGLIDDPGAQRRRPLLWSPPTGNLALVGSLGSGTTTAMRSALVAIGPSADVYVLDTAGDATGDDSDALAACVSVVGARDLERRDRLLHRLDEEMGARQSARPESPSRPIVLGIDGLGALHTALLGPNEMGQHAQLMRILGEGVAVGVHVVATFERPAAVPASMLAAFAQRWLFHLDDPLDASGLGVKAARNPPAIAGRMVIAAGQLEAQVAVLDSFAAGDKNSPAARSAAPAEAISRPARPAPIGTLAACIDATQLVGTAVLLGGPGLLMGVDFVTLQPAVLEVPDGEHALVLGPARSGRSTALVRAIAGWRAVHPTGTVIVHGGRRPSLVLEWARRALSDVTVAADEAALLAAVTALVDVEPGQPGGEAAPHDARRVLVAIDDAERVDDVGGALAALVNARHRHVTVVAAGRPETLRTMFGHWTAVVRRSRLGLVMTTGSDSDGELLGEVLPRRLPVAARAGLAWLYDAGGRRLIQVATDLAPP